MIKTQSNKPLFYILLPCAFLVVVYWSLYGYWIISSPLTFNEIDIDKSGWISHAEADYAGQVNLFRAGLEALRNLSISLLNPSAEAYN